MGGAARLAPPSRPLAATLIGGLRPGSLRVHGPCKETTHGSRLGFPGRRPPRGPAAPGNVARGLNVPPEERKKGEPQISGTPFLGWAHVRPGARGRRCHLSDFDQEDPRSVRPWATRMGKELGDELGEDFEPMMEEAFRDEGDLESAHDEEP